MKTTIILLVILATCYIIYSIYKNWVEKQPKLERRMLRMGIIKYSNRTKDIISILILYIIVVCIVFGLVNFFKN